MIYDNANFNLLASFKAILHAIIASGTVYKASAKSAIPYFIPL